MTSLPLFSDQWWPEILGGRGDHWNTPPEVLSPVLEFFGEVDTDPCTNAGSIVQAGLTYDGSCEEQDGLIQPWRGSSFVNPPFSRGQPVRWLTKAAMERRKRGCEVIVLLNVATSTEYFAEFAPVHVGDLAENVGRERQRFKHAASRIAFWRSRIAFLEAGKPIEGNRFEQMFLYFGTRERRFREVFREVAWVP